MCQRLFGEDGEGFVLLCDGVLAKCGVVDIALFFCVGYKVFVPKPEDSHPLMRLRMHPEILFRRRLKVGCNAMKPSGIELLSNVFLRVWCSWLREGRLLCHEFQQCDTSNSSSKTTSGLLRNSHKTIYFSVSHFYQEHVL